MPTYEMVMVRFNMSTEEKELYNKLDPNNRAGSIKDFLKKAINGGDEVNKRAIESIVLEVLSNHNYVKKPVENPVNNKIANIAKGFLKE